MTRRRDTDDLAQRVRAKMRGAKPSRNGTAARHTEPPPEPVPAPAVETISAAALLQLELPEPRWAVEGVLPEGLSIWAGKPKLGKSWLALNVALAVATGGTALGSISVEAGDVLYLALEDTKRRLKDRLAKLLHSQQAAAPERLTLATAWPRADQGGLAALSEWLGTHAQARLVIIDTWARFKRVRFLKGNEYEADYADAAEVKALADHHGVAVKVLHHCRKMGAVDPLEEVSGTLGLTGAADAILVLRRERGQHDATLHVTGRDVEEAELALRWDAQYALWSIIGQAEEYRVSKEQQEVIDLLRKLNKPLSPCEAAVALGKTRNAAKLLLWKLGEKGILSPVGGAYVLANTGNHGNRGNQPPVSGGDEEGNREETIQTPFD